MSKFCKPVGDEYSTWSAYCTIGILCTGLRGSNLVSLLVILIMMLYIRLLLVN